jgi:hypothetical protein
MADGSATPTLANMHLKAKTPVQMPQVDGDTKVDRPSHGLNNHIPIVTVLVVAVMAGVVYYKAKE